MWLFVSPVVYPSSQISEPWRTLSAINPMVGVVEGFRWAMLGHRKCPLGPDRRSPPLAAVVFLIAGLAYFDRVERAFADFVCMGEIAIQTHELGKSYTLGVKGAGYGTLRESDRRSGAAAVPARRRAAAKKRKGDTLWALRDLSLTIRTARWSA